jgi:hypothetical protein
MVQSKSVQNVVLSIANWAWLLPLDSLTSQNVLYLWECPLHVMILRKRGVGGRENTQIDNWPVNVLYSWPVTWYDFFVCFSEGKTWTMNNHNKDERNNKTLSANLYSAVTWPFSINGCNFPLWTVSLFILWSLQGWVWGE